MKVYVEGSDPSIRVPRRAIALTDGTVHTLYDTSGPYSDAEQSIDIRRGLPPLREPWIEARGDTRRTRAPVVDLPARPRRDARARRAAVSRAAQAAPREDRERT